MPPLSLYLIGAPLAGKTAVFDALVQTPDGPHFTSKSGHRLGTVTVPDPRLDALRALFHPKKFVPAEITFVDVAIPHGKTKGFSSLNAFLSDADAFALVVQAFGQTDANGKNLNPTAQLENVLLDLAVADLEKIERRIDKIQQELKRGLKQNLPSLAPLQRCQHALETTSTLRNLPLPQEEEKLLASFSFLSRKPIMIIANTSEETCVPPPQLAAACAEKKLPLLAFCAPLETEIASLPPQDQPPFLADYGLAEPARIRLIQTAYSTLSLISFFTVGPDEVRAWTLHRGDTALTAAGKIHTDFARGFIRAETIPAPLLLQKKSYAACREAGLLRLEGKTYPVQDGDVLEIRANA